jgi:retinol dehydrogenase 12
VEPGCMQGRTCVVTGATSGIGLETAAALARLGARVIGVGRDPARAAQARELLRAASTGGQADVLTADLSSRAEVKELARRILGLAPRLDVLVNNAGTFRARRALSVDGIEMQLAVNHLAGFLLTRHLLPGLSLSPDARVIGLSSASHYAGRMRWGDLGMSRGYFGLAAYDQSKLAVVLFTRELARRLGPHSSISVYAVDPGLVRTEIGAKGTGSLARLVWRLRAGAGMSAHEAAGWVTFLAAAPSVRGVSGAYWKEGRRVPPSAAAQGSADAARLWTESELLCGEYDAGHRPGLAPSGTALVSRPAPAV